MRALREAVLGFRRAPTLTRGASTATTGGLANPLLSTIEMGTSFLLAGLAIVVALGLGAVFRYTRFGLATRAPPRSPARFAVEI